MSRRMRRLSWFLAAVLGVIGSGGAGTAEPSGEEALWVAGAPEVLKLADPTGALLLRLTDVAEARVVAVDARRSTVWVWAGRKLAAYGFQGEPRLAVPVDLPDAEEAELAVHPEDGSVWLAVGAEVWSFSASGQKLLSLQADGRVEALAVDATEGLLWVGTRRSAMAYDPVTGALVRALPAGSLRDLDAGPAGLWVAGKGFLRRYSADGGLLRSVAAGDLLHVVATLDGGAWAATGKELLRIGPAGQILATLRPFDGRGEIVDLATDPGDGSVWAAIQDDLVRVSATGEVTRPSGLGVPLHVRDLALYSDILPPEIEIRAPAPDAVLETRLPPVEVSYEDVGTGIDLQSLDVRVDGVALTCQPEERGAVCSLQVELADGAHTVTASVRDLAGNPSVPATVGFTVALPPADPLPPDPAKVATPIDPTVSSNLAEDTAFLYLGDDPIQTGAEPEAIDPRRAAVVRGRVIGRDGAPLAGARISILGHPELGSTLSRADGMYDLAVDGGGTLAVEVEKDGSLPVQRPMDVPWNDYAWAPDVALIPYDKAATVVRSGSAEMQVARGSGAADEDGSRRPTVLFPAGTRAERILPDGTAEPLSSFTVRATEYTVGPHGPEAMPGPLTPPVGYTYAVELSVDEAIAAGATRVAFSQPVVHYVENFLDFPVGGAVPAAFWDRQGAVWVPSDNGRIVRLLGVSSGLAELDVTGSGTPADAAALAALGITEAELRQLALLYAPGQSLWRVAVPHFSAMDLNWAELPPEDAAVPEEPEPETDEPEEDSCEQAGSIIECQNQVLGEVVPVTGAPFALHYRSDRMPGRAVARSFTLALTGSTVPSRLQRIDLTIDVAGRRFQQSFPAAPDQSYTFSWDGRDAYGRLVQGRVPAHVEVGWVYQGVYLLPGGRFGSYGTAPIPGSRARQEAVISRNAAVFLGTWSARDQGLGGWSLTPHHAYEPARRLVHFGNGRRLSQRSLGLVRKSVAGNTAGSRAEGILATEARIFSLGGIAASPDGGFYYSEATRVRRVDPEGIVRTVAGRLTAGFSGDGGPATAALLNFPAGLALAPDGSLYVADKGNGRIRRIGPDGVIQTVAGALESPTGLALAPDGGLYVSELDRHRVRRLTPDGWLWTVAGTGVEGFSGDGGPAAKAQLKWPLHLAIDREGNLYIDDSGNARVRRVGTDGVIGTVMGGGRLLFYEGMPGTDLFAPFGMNGLQATADGSLLTVTREGILRLGPDGLLATVAGGNVGSNLALGPGGDILSGADSGVLRFSPLLPGAGAEGYAVPSQDGAELYLFDGRGRHLRTLDALTGAPRWQFFYDSGGRLSQLVDGSGNVTRIERRANDSPAAILSPDGQRTSLGVDGEGYLARIANPKGEAFTFASSPEGLLLSQTDPKGHLSRFFYDSGGQLIRDEDAAGGFKALARSERPEGYAVEVSTALGRRTSYAVDRPATAEAVRIGTLPDGEVFQTTSSRTGTHILQSPDGTKTTVAEGQDPRFGNLTPFAASAQIRTPSGLTSSLSRFRSVSLADPSNPLSLVLASEFLIENGRASTGTYDALQRKLTLTSAQGRKRILGLDAQGRVATATMDGLEPVALSYDERGRLSSILQGTGEAQRIFHLSYGADGQLSSVTDPLDRTVSFEYDEAGRLRTQVLPDGRAIGLAYDAAGNPTAVAPPGRPAHAFAYTPVDLLEEYAPPALGAWEVRTRYEHNLDRDLRQVIRPDGRTMGLDYDTAGRLSGLQVARGRLGYEYLASGQLAGITAPDGEELRFTYDGFLPLRTTWSGPIAGTVEHAYDADFRVKSLTVGGTPAVTFAYDQDSLLVRAGSLTLTRDSRNGLLTGTALGRVTTAHTYNGFGEPSTFEAQVDAAPVLSIRYERDRLGRIVRKEETVTGTTETQVYTYDLTGRLVAVEKDGAILSRSEYDGNGNRLSGPGGTADYDDQDRLLRYGDTAFSYTANGELKSRTQGGQIVAYDYDELGNLRTVTLSDGIRIDYVIDGRNRRIGKKVNGALVQGFLYQDQLEPVAELDGTGRVVAVFVYGSRLHVPDYMVKDGRTYRIIADHLGSPRLVIDTGTGAVVQRMDYDEFGRVILDTSPRFQPFGFAGGLYDPQTRLVRFGARDYDSPVGRWTAKDPIWFEGGDSNLYGYVLSDPVNLIDLLGLYCWNLSKEPWIVKPETGGMIELPPGYVYQGPIDGVRSWGGNWYKVPTGTDVVVQPNGIPLEVSTPGTRVPDFPDLGPSTDRLPGWKKNDFYENPSRHPDWQIPGPLPQRGSPLVPIPPGCECM